MRSSPPSPRSAAALAYLHGAGVVHGDVSAANILFSARRHRPAGRSRRRPARPARSPTPRARRPTSIPIRGAGRVPGPPSDVFMLGGGGAARPGRRAAVAGPTAATRRSPWPRGRAISRPVGAPAGRGRVCAPAMAAVRAARAAPSTRCTAARAADLALDLRHSGTPVAVELTAGRTRPEPPLANPCRRRRPRRTRARRARRRRAVPAGRRASRRGSPFGGVRPSERTDVDPSPWHDQTSEVGAGRDPGRVARPRTTSPGAARGRLRGPALARCDVAPPRADGLDLAAAPGHPGAAPPAAPAARRRGRRSSSPCWLPPWRWR